MTETEKTDRSSMMRLIQFQWVRYGIVGMINVVIDFLILNVSLQVLHLNLFWSTFFGFAAGGLMGYFLHSRWTFAYDAAGREVIKLSHFLLVAGIGLLATEIIVHVLTDTVGIYYNYSKVVALVVSVSWAYSASKWWVFRKEQ